VRCYSLLKLAGYQSSRGEKEVKTWNDGIDLNSREKKILYNSTKERGGNSHY